MGVNPSKDEDSKEEFVSLKSSSGKRKRFAPSPKEQQGGIDMDSSIRSNSSSSYYSCKSGRSTISNESRKRGRFDGATSTTTMETTNIAYNNNSSSSSNNNNITINVNGNHHNLCYGGTVPNNNGGWRTAASSGVPMIPASVSEPSLLDESIGSGNTSVTATDSSSDGGGVVSLPMNNHEHHNFINNGGLWNNTAATAGLDVFGPLPLPLPPANNNNDSTGNSDGVAAPSTIVGGYPHVVIDPDQNTSLPLPPNLITNEGGAAALGPAMFPPDNDNSNNAPVAAPITTGTYPHVIIDSGHNTNLEPLNLDTNEGAVAALGPIPFPPVSSSSTTTNNNAGLLPTFQNQRRPFVNNSTGGATTQQRPPAANSVSTFIRNKMNRSIGATTPAATYQEPSRIAHNPGVIPPVSISQDPQLVQSGLQHGIDPYAGVPTGCRDAVQNTAGGSSLPHGSTPIGSCSSAAAMASSATVRADGWRPRGVDGVAPWRPRWRRPQRYNRSQGSY